ncbi:hypothetical protein OG470_20565 [Micromonospora sp. NBC_00389]|uniref:hypothetical protein n=1 Tax=Micromonospora sp. NBC_00389 TaxID=2903586 RepID=UPI002E1C032E
MANARSAAVADVVAGLASAGTAYVRILWVYTQDWLNTADRFAPGRELFRSHRRFRLWAQTVSHGQLLLRSPRSSDHPTRIDVLFKPVSAQKVRWIYDGLVIRCPSGVEQERIQQQMPGGLRGMDDRVFALETADSLDWVVAMAVGWHEDDDAGDISRFVWLDQGRKPVVQRSLDGADGGLSHGLASSLEEVVAAVRAGHRPTDVADPQYAYLHVVMVRTSWPGQSGTVAPVGAFLTRQAADDYLTSRHPVEGAEFYVEAVPLSF